MMKDLKKLIELVSRHTEIFERASDHTYAQDARTISDDVENMLRGEYEFYSGEFVKKTEKKLKDISLPSRDTDKLTDELKKSDISLIGSLYVCFWRRAEANGDRNPFSDKNRPSFLTILYVLGGAVKKETEKLLRIIDRDYALFYDADLVRMGETEGIDTHRNFESLLTDDAHEMYERFGFYTRELVDTLENVVFKGRYFSLDDSESWDVVYGIDDYMCMGTLYVLKWRGVTHWDITDPFGGNNIQHFRHILELLCNLVDEIYWNCVRYETWIRGRKMSAAEICDDMKRTDKRLDKSFGYSVGRMGLGGQGCLFDKKSYDYVHGETEAKCAVYRKICDWHMSGSGNSDCEKSPKFNEWEGVGRMCELTIERWKNRYML